MAGQTTVNGNGRTDDTASLTRGAGELAHDVIELGELQVSLLQADLQDAMDHSLVPAGIIACGAISALSCAPAVVLSFGFALAEFTALSTAGGLLIAAISVFLLSLLAVGLAAWRLSSRLTVFKRSIDEWKRNLRWIKAVLRHGGAASPTKVNR